MNFRRKRPRIKGCRKRPSNMSSWPAWWDRLFHTRPRRRESRELEGRLLRGEVDPDEAVGPTGNHRPHEYYW